MNCTNAAALLIALASAATLPAQAEIIYMFHQGTGSGTIGGITFTDADFTITTSADFDDTIPYVNGLRLINETASINITGVGIFDITSETQNYVNNAFGTIGFTRTSLGDLFNGPYNPAFFNWDMTTELGPVSGLGDLLQWSFENVTTTGGVLNFLSNPTDATFRASYTLPTPSALAFLAIATLSTTRRRRV